MRCSFDQLRTLLSAKVFGPVRDDLYKKKYIKVRYFPEGYFIGEDHPHFQEDDYQNYLDQTYGGSLEVNDVGAGAGDGAGDDDDAGDGADGDGEDDDEDGAGDAEDDTDNAVEKPEEVFNMRIMEDGDFIIGRGPGGQIVERDALETWLRISNFSLEQNFSVDNHKRGVSRRVATVIVHQTELLRLGVVLQAAHAHYLSELHGGALT